MGIVIKSSRSMHSQAGAWEREKDGEAKREEK